MFALLLQLHAPAHALSCVAPGPVPELSIQTQDVVPPEVPLIGFHGGRGMDLDYELVAGDGSVVPLDGEWFGSSVRFSAGGPLATGTYTYQRSGYPDDLQPPEATTFTVEDGLPPDAPDAPIDLYRQWFSSYDAEDKLQVRWTESAGAAHYEIEVAPTADFVAPVRGFTPSEPAQFGSTDCAPPETTGYDSTTTSFIRIRAIGHRGDASDWSDTLRVGPRPFHGCATTGGTASGFGLVVVLSLLGVRRGRSGR